jgi:anti-sigma B factor antagonist
VGGNDEAVHGRCLKLANGEVANATFVGLKGDRMALRIQTEVSGDVFILRCEGRIVFGDEAAVLRERVKSLLSGTPKVVINVDGVEYIDSGGIGVLVGLFVSAANRGGEVKLVSPTRHISDALHQTRLDTVFNLYGSNDEAVAAFRKQAA